MPASRLKVRAVGPRFGRKPRYVHQYGGTILYDAARALNRGDKKLGYEISKHGVAKAGARMVYSTGLKYAKKRYPKATGVWTYAVQKGGRGNVVATPVVSDPDASVEDEDGSTSSIGITKKDIAKIPVKTKEDLLWKVINSDAATEAASNVGSKMAESLVNKIFLAQIIREKRRGRRRRLVLKKLKLKEVRKEVFILSSGTLPAFKHIFGLFG